jgi:hypothetical protein
MLDLSPHIKSLLFDHNCVIIPDFGGFVANPQSAKINQLKSRIDPPFKEIGFNPRLTKNDGLLANHIYHEKNLSYENAIQNITEVVEEIKSTVNAGKTFRMEEIGSFYLDSNKSLRFSAFNKNNNLAPIYFPLKIFNKKTFIANKKCKNFNFIEDCIA